MNFQPRGKQFEVVALPYTGHNVITGSAGSGKSVCAILRAMSINKRCNKNAHILTYNNSLVNYMKNIITDLNKDNQYNIFIDTYHRFLTQYLRKNNQLSNGEILSSNYKKSELIKRAIALTEALQGDITILKNEEFVIDEIKWMQKVGALTKESYENIIRTGRGKGNLNKKDRKYIFMVYEKYIRERQRLGFKYDWDDLAYYSLQHITNNPVKESSHIIIDEGQDFPPTMVNFLSKYIGDNGSLMYLGDQGQQIFGKGITWKSYGLSIRKVYKLQENYRNTKEIESLANEIRKGMQLTEEEVLASQNSETNGAIPSLIKFPNTTEKLNYITQLAKGLNNRGSIGILCLKNEDVKSLSTTLSYKGVSNTVISRNEFAFKGQNGVFIGTFHALKGLEFDYVILHECNDGGFEVPTKGSISDEEYDESIEKARKLLYVGVTRARKELYMTYTGELSGVIPKISNLYSKVVVKW